MYCVLVKSNSFFLTGYWLLHDQHFSYWTKGFDVILHVGRPYDVPPTPKDFPRCGSWVGPEYFLIWRLRYRGIQNWNPKSSDVAFGNRGQSRLKVLMWIWIDYVTKGEVCKIRISVSRNALMILLHSICPGNLKRECIHSLNKSLRRRNHTV